MKTLTTFLFSIIIVVVLTSCKKEIPGCTDYQADNYNSEATYDNNTCQYSGDVIFYITQPINQVDVHFNGQTKTITSYYTWTPSCWDPGCATFHAPAGSYYVTAEEQGFGGATWADWVTVYKNDCNEVVLNP